MPEGKKPANFYENSSTKIDKRAARNKWKLVGRDGPCDRDGVGARRG